MNNRGEGEAPQMMSGPGKPSEIVPPRKVSRIRAERKFSQAPGQRKASEGQSNNRKGSEASGKSGENRKASQDQDEAAHSRNNSMLPQLTGPQQYLDPTQVNFDQKRENVERYAPEYQPMALRKLFVYIESQRLRYITTLREAVCIRSVSSWSKARSELLRMVEWTGAKLKELGFNLELRKAGTQIVRDTGVVIPVPPIILASLGDDPNKKTLLIYGHLDVKPANMSEGWDTNPFYMTDFHGHLVGRGTSDDKGPVLGWIHAIESFQKCNMSLPINIKIIFESMGECGSDGLKDLLQVEKEGFLKSVDLVVLSDSYWLGRSRPCLCYGLRGICYFHVEIDGGTKDLHSGVFGGILREPLPDLLYLLDTLVDSEGNILIPGVEEDVVSVTEPEVKLYDSIDFDVDDFQQETGIIAITAEKQTPLLMNRWRFPCLSIHGVQGAFHKPGAKTIIPRKVIGKFSIRLVPNMDPEKVCAKVTKYLNDKWAARGSTNSMVVYTTDDSLPPWTSNPLHLNYRAARRAIAMVYGSFPDLIREGGNMVNVIHLQEATKKNVLLLPMGCCDDSVHTKNEKLDARNFIEGTKVMAAYIWECGKIKGPVV